MRDEEPIYNFKEFGDLIDEHFPKQHILDYYPYGNKTEHYGLFRGSAHDLKTEYLEKHNEGKTKEKYVLNIFKEVSRAMNYLTVHYNGCGNNRQRLEAFSMYSLLHNGFIGWTKKPLEGLSEEEKEKLYNYHEVRYNLLQGGNANDNFGGLEHKLHNRSVYGIYEVKHFPLLKQTRTNSFPETLYTEQELAAIEFMVDMAFENLC